MSSTDLKQRLVAILAADAVGYSRLMACDDRATVAALDAARAVFRSGIEAHHGRVIDMAGDSVLAVFETAAGAVAAAMTVQQALGAATVAVPQERRMLFRIGLHMGDVIEKEDGTVYGDGVNIASRLCAVAEAGGILVSDAVHGAVRDRIAAGFDDKGEHPMKNIAHPVHAFRLKAAEQAPARVPALRPPERPSLAVLPFTNMSGDPEQEYFADGITEDIITDCSKISGLFVIARNSTFTFKKQSVDIKDVGARLGVRHVLEGSVRRHGKRVRINVQLIDAASGGHVWAERYDRELEDIFLVQDEVTRKIVQTLEVRLTGNEEALRQERGKVNGEAYDYLMRAKTCIVQFTAEALAEAREMLGHALAIDPDMSHAHAYLAIARGVEYANAWNGRTARDLEESLAVARRACQADPFEPMAHHALSNALMWLRRLDEAESAARRSVALDPNSSQGHGTLGIILDFAGRQEESVETLGQAVRLDPQFSLWLHALGRAQFVLGRYAEAEALFRRRLIHMPGSDVTRAYLASLYGHTGRNDEAGRIWRELMAIHPEYEIGLTLRVLPYGSPAPLEQFVAGLRKAGLVP